MVTEWRKMPHIISRGNVSFSDIDYQYLKPKDVLIVYDHEGGSRTEVIVRGWMLKFARHNDTGYWVVPFIKTSSLVPNNYNRR